MRTREPKANTKTAIGRTGVMARVKGRCKELCSHGDMTGSALICTDLALSQSL